MVPLEVVQRPKPTTLGYKIFRTSTRCLLSWWPRACSLPLLGKSALWRVRACQEHRSLLRQRCSSKDSKAFWNMAFFQLARQSFFLSRGNWERGLAEDHYVSCCSECAIQEHNCTGKKKKVGLAAFLKRRLRNFPYYLLTDLELTRNDITGCFLRFLPTLLHNHSQPVSIKTLHKHWVIWPECPWEVLGAATIPGSISAPRELHPEDPGPPIPPLLTGHLSPPILAKVPVPRAAQP